MDEVHTKILFDSISSQFSLSIFVQQFLLHATFPLLVPYFFYRHGWTFFYAQNFQISRIGVCYTFYKRAAIIIIFRLYFLVG